MGLLDPGSQIDIAAEVEPVRHVVQVPQDLRPGRIPLAPIPFLLEFLRERVRVVQRLDVAAHAWVPVPVPGAADPIALLEHPHVQAHAAEAVQRVQPGEAGADHDRVEVRPIEFAIDRPRDEIESRDAPWYEPHKCEEAVHLATEALVLDAHPVLGQPPGVGLALVAQYVVLGRQDHGRRQAGEALSAQRRRIRANAHRRVWCVVVPEPRHRVAADDQLVRGIDIRRRVEVAVGDRIHEHLQRDLRAGGRGALRHDSCEVPTGAVAGNGQGDRGAGDLLGIRGRPFERRPGIVKRRRVPVFRREPVINQHDCAIRPVGEQARERVELVERAEHPAAPVVIDDHSAGSVARDEDSRPDLAAVSRRDLPILNSGHRGSFAVKLDHLPAGLPGLARAQLMNRRHAARGELGDEGCTRQVEHR